MSRLAAWFGRHPDVVPPSLRLVPRNLEAEREQICLDMLALVRKLERGNRVLLADIGAKTKLHDAVEDMRAKVTQMLELQKRVSR